MFTLAFMTTMYMNVFGGQLALSDIQDIQEN